ncbi:hypothetical protein ACP1MA_000211 [Salmonella enterica subsp. diarizonae serovar 65:c:z str. SA20044251]
MKNITTALIEFLDDRGIGHLQKMGLGEYKFHLKRDAFLFIDSHGFLVDDFTGRTFAASKEQLDLLIGHLQGLRDEMNYHHEKYL